MDDLISRQAAIDRVNNIVEVNHLREDLVWFTPIGVKALIEEQPSAQRWIPVTERLPDIKEHHVSDPCIVYCENGAYGFAELEENIFGQVGWNCERDDEYHEPLGEVVAWMPLPEPYREDGDI